MRIWWMMAFAAIVGGAGCTRILGAHAIQPSQAVDTPDVWIYLQTNDEGLNGIYRCYDGGARKPVCVQARLAHP